MKNSQIFYTFIILSMFQSIHSQTWQWAQRGGSTDNMRTPDNRRERVRSVAVDRNNNVYTLSPVGLYDLNIAGVPKTSYNENPGEPDISIAKFDCRGNYKWSRIIGGNNQDFVTRIFADSLGNVYTAGKVIRNSPTHLVTFGQEGLTGHDTILEFDYQTHKQSLFLVKYDSIGNMKWLRMPQPENISIPDSWSHSYAIDLHVEPNGTSHWFVRITPGVYADGAFAHTGTEPALFIFKYSSEGNFISAVPLQMHLEGIVNERTKMVYDRSSERYYFTGTTTQDNPNWNSNFNGQPLTGTFFVAAFNSQGSLLWMKQNTHTSDGSSMSHDVTVDDAGNIYFTGGSRNVDTFNGSSFPVTSGTSFPFLIKLNPAGDTIWMTNANTGSFGYGNAVVLNGEEVAITSGYGSMQWGSHSLQIQPNSGYDAYVARFNKNTGAVLGLHSLESSFGSEDFGTSITADHSGNYLVGGEFSYRITVNGQTHMNMGSQSDFFVAKLGNNSCETLSIGKESKEPTLKAYPNPTSGTIHLSRSTTGSYALYNSLGSLVQKGSLDHSDTIDIERHPAGIYLLSIIDTDGLTQVLKVVKN